MFNKMRKKYDEKLSHEFLPEALEIVEKPASPIGHFMLWTTIIILISFLLWSVLGKIDETANARGKIITVDGVQLLQAVNSGVIKEIYVEEGDKVKKGDKIIELESSVIEENLSYSKKYSELLELKIELLKKISDGEEIEEPLESDKTFEEANVVNYVITLQKQIQASIEKMKADVAACKKKLSIEKENILVIEKRGEELNEKQSKLQMNCQEESLEEKRLQIIKEKIKNLEKEVKDYEELYKNDAIPKEEWKNKKEELALEKAQLDLQKKIVKTEKEEQEAKIQELAEQKSENESMLRIQESKVQIAKEELKTAKNNLKSTEESNKEAVLELIMQAMDEKEKNEILVEKNNEDYQSTIVRASLPGVVQGIVLNTVGGVVAPAQILAEIVPDSSKLVFEANLPNKDIGFVEIDQEAGIKLDTYNFQKYGRLNGIVKYISPNAIQDEALGLVYKIKIEVDVQDFQNKHNELVLSPGMQGTVEIKTGSRRIIEFFLEPLIKNLDESLKVR